MNFRIHFDPPIPNWVIRCRVDTAFMPVEASRAGAEASPSQSACTGAQFATNSFSRPSCDSQKEEISLSGVMRRGSGAVLIFGGSGASADRWNGSFVARST